MMYQMIDSIWTSEIAQSFCRKNQLLMIAYNEYQIKQHTDVQNFSYTSSLPLRFRTLSHIITQA